MKTHTLQIRFTDTTQHEPRAWFLAGPRAADWLAEILTWDVPHSAVRLLVVPCGNDNREPLGVLAMVEGKSPSDVSTRCHRYGQLAKRLFLPSEARLEPAVDARELERLLAPHMQYVWHPTAGLIGFEPADVLRVADLLLPLPTRDGNWNRADPGIAFGRRLISVEATRPVSFDMILQSGQDDIGTQQDSLGELPPAPGEKPQSGIGKAMSAPLRPIANLVNWMANRVPANANGETWVDKLQNWANKVLSPEWQSARERELARLMHMLQSNPDDGLKYALPMGGEAGRGVAPPSSQLSSRNVDFRMSSSGGPVDYWDIPPEMMFQLTTRYRELAEREIRLGRHRRAAYIYAELLGEMESAAAALKTGGYFREAAVVYERKLQRPLVAAACLEEGGLWNEAIVLYEKHDEFEKCGQIYRRLEQHDQAEAAFRKAAESYRLKRDFLTSAKLFERELREADVALEVLQAGWPNSPQAKDCLSEEFRLLAREGRHTSASRRIAALVESRAATSKTAELSEVLAGSSREYPDADVRDRSADATRVVVSRRLSLSQRADLPLTRRLMRTIESLAPEDRLLARDCARYGREDERAKPPTIHRSGSVEQVQRTRFLANMRLTSAAASNRYYFAAGFRDQHFIVTRGEWNALDVPPQIVSWSPLAISRFAEHPVLLAPSPNDSHHAWVQIVDGPPLPARGFPVAETGAQPVRALTPPWTSRKTLAMAQTANGVTWSLAIEGDAVLSAYSANDVPILTRQLPVLFEQSDEPQILPMHARSEGVFLGMDEWLVSVDARQRDQSQQLPQPILSLSGSAPHSRVRVAASFELGGVVFWKDTSSTRPFGDGLASPLTTFTVSGMLVAVDHTTIEVYRTDRDQLTLIHKTDSPGEPIAVMPVRRSEFAIMDANGWVSVYRVAE